MIKEIIQIANELDSRGLVNEADVLDVIIRKASAASLADMAMAEAGSLLGEETVDPAGWSDNDWKSIQSDAERAAEEWDKETRRSPDDGVINTLDDLTMVIDDPDCDLECAENAGLKYRSSQNYQENEDIERDIVNALVDSKRPEPGEEA